MTPIDYIQIERGSFAAIVATIAMCAISIALIFCEIESWKVYSKRYQAICALILPFVLLVALLIVNSTRYDGYKKALNEENTVYVDGVQTDVDPLFAMKSCKTVLDHDRHWILCTTRYSKTASYFNDFNKTIPEADQ